MVTTKPLERAILVLLEMQREKAVDNKVVNNRTARGKEGEHNDLVKLKTLINGRVQSLGKGLVVESR